MEFHIVYVVSERPAVGLSSLMVDLGGLSSEETAKSGLALYMSTSPLWGLLRQNIL